MLSRLLCGMAVVAVCAVPFSRAADDAQFLANRIDHWIAAGWKAKNVKPAGLADDAEFLRRVYLDVAGRIPRAGEARIFLEDTRADKRQRLVEQLLESPHYANHFANVWRAWMLPQGNTQIGNQFIPALESWLRQRTR